MKTSTQALVCTGALFLFGWEGFLACGTLTAVVNYYRSHLSYQLV